MRAKRSVLLALTDTHHGFFKGAARYAREHQWHVTADMIYTAKIPIGWRGDGIVSFIGDRNDLAEFILSSGLPAVEISKVRNDINLPRVEGDSDMIGRMAAEHFLERDYRNFAWAPFQDDIVNAERYRGFVNRLARAGLTCHVLPSANVRHGPQSKLDWTARRKLLTRELERLPKPLAVFGYNDCVAADVIAACDDAGLFVPESVAVLGVDNDTILCECVHVPLSSVCHDLEGMAYKACALLDRLMAGRKPPKEVLRVRPLGLVTRRSTDIVAVNNLQVARALRYIQDQHANPLLGVVDVVAATNLSRRALEIAFRNEMKRSVNEEIMRLRMEQVKRMLTTTDLKVVQVAKLTGFTRPSHLFRTFRKTLGLSPKKWRAQQAAEVKSSTSPLARKPAKQR